MLVVTVPVGEIQCHRQLLVVNDIGLLDGVDYMFQSGFCYGGYSYILTHTDSPRCAHRRYNHSYYNQTLLPAFLCPTS